MTLNKFTGMTARQKMEQEQIKLKNAEIMGLMYTASSFQKTNTMKPGDTSSGSSVRGRGDSDIPQYLQKYFTKKEFNKAVKDSFKPLEPVVIKKVGGGGASKEICESDSEPSIDNYEL